jgi:hypothetical protein
MTDYLSFIDKNLSRKRPIEVISPRGSRGNIPGPSYMGRGKAPKEIDPEIVAQL